MTASDLQGLILAATNLPRSLASRFPELWQRYLTVVLDGIRPEHATLMPSPEVPPAELGHALDRGRTAS